MHGTQPNAIDPAKLDAFLARAVGDLSAGYGGVMVSLGNKLGLYKAMAGAGPLSSRELANRAGCAERYVREWLGAQVAGGLAPSAFTPAATAMSVSPGLTRSSAICGLRTWVARTRVHRVTNPSPHIPGGHPMAKPWLSSAWGSRTNWQGSRRYP